MLIAVLSVSLGRIPGVGPSGVPYPLFIFAGLAPWTLFAKSLTGASNILIGGEAMTTKVGTALGFVEARMIAFQTASGRL